MHTRRLAAFLIGAWLVGCLIMAYVSSQSYSNVERILGSPPGPVAKDLEDLGSDITRSLLRYEASELNRFLAQIWGVIQIGLGLALFASGLLTSHRSKFLLGAAAAMTLLVTYQILMIQPSLNALGRSFDFLPPGAGTRERESFQSQNVLWSVMEVLKVLLGLALSGRLLFDRYNWRDKVMPKSKRQLKRRHRSDMVSKTAEAPPVEAEAPADSKATAELD